MKLLFCLFSLPLLAPQLSEGSTLTEAVQSAVIQLKTSKVTQYQPKQIVIQVVNYASQKTDDLAEQVEIELYKDIAPVFPNIPLVSLADSQTGVSLSQTLLIKGELKPKGPVVHLQLKATTGTKGILLGLGKAEFENQAQMSQQLVAVLPIEGKDLTDAQRSAFSDVFQSALSKTGKFSIASSAEVKKMSPDEIQKVQNCTRDECATIIGEQLGVDRVIFATVNQIGQGLTQVSAKILNVKNNLITKSETAQHKGPLSELGPTIKKLAQNLALTKEEKELQSLIKAAEAGDAKAQFSLGGMYFQGTGVPQNSEKAAYWTRKAAEQGIAEAQFNLKTLTRRGSHGTVTLEQKGTDLFWAIERREREMGWQRADDHCYDLRQGGYSDWRLPTEDELKAIYELVDKDPKAAKRFKFIKDCYWSSSTYRSDGVWNVDFSDGSTWNFCNSKGSTNYVKCVRNGN